MLCFVNLDRNNNQSDTFKIPSALAARIGLDDARQYNVVNLAAYERPPAVTGRRGTFLWGSPKSGLELRNTGFTVSLNKVPVAAGDWDTAPYEAHYLKLVDVTDPLEAEIERIEAMGSGLEITCSSTPGWYYHLESRESLDASWTTVESNVKAEGTTLTLMHEGGSGADTGFYRVRVSYIEE
jgi:hypothetical protein